MLVLSDGLCLRMRKLSLTRSSELKDEEDKIVKSSGETGCPILGGGLTRFLPVTWVSAEAQSALKFVRGEADSSGQYITNYIVDT